MAGIHTTADMAAHIFELLDKQSNLMRGGDDSLPLPYGLRTCGDGQAEFAVGPDEEQIFAVRIWRVS